MDAAFLLSLCKQLLSFLMDVAVKSKLLHHPLGVDLKLNNRGRHSFATFRWNALQHKHIATISIAKPMLLANSFLEYEPFEDDPDIGTIHDGTVPQIAAAIVAHEFAHIVVNLHYGYCETDPHGHRWQHIYRLLRRAAYAHLPALVSFPGPPVSARNQRS